MTKRFYSVINLLLTSFIALMGFAACKTSRKVQQGSDTEKLYGPPVQMTRGDSINAGLLPPPEQKVKPADPIKLVYGPPPVRKEKK